MHTEKPVQNVPYVDASSTSWKSTETLTGSQVLPLSAVTRLPTSAGSEVEAVTAANEGLNSHTRV